MTEGCAVAGIYDSGPKQNMRLDGVKMEQIIGKKGYSLYQVASGLRLKKGMQLHLNRWLITFFVPDSVNPAEKYDIWLSLRFDNERKIVFCDRCLLKTFRWAGTD